jgi:hypothetical protein
MRNEGTTVTLLAMTHKTQELAYMIDGMEFALILEDKNLIRQLASKSIISDRYFF